MYVFADLVFYFFSLTMILCAGSVILSRHPVFSLLFLVGCFLSASCILLLLECELLAFLFLTVYVGAIAILFLFAVMMLDFKRYSMQKNIIAYIPAGFFIGVALLSFLVIEINNFFIVVPSNSLYYTNHINWYDLTNSITEVEALGHILYSYFVLHFLLAGLILLVVLFGVVCLTNVTDVKKVNNGKQQALFKQISRAPKF